MDSAEPYNVVLYHGTSSKFLKRILSEGLKPRKATGLNSNWHPDSLRKDYPLFPVDISSNPNLVYLTNTPEKAESLGLRAIELHGGNLVILVVGIENTENLKPDEDSYAETWEKSLEKIGRCAYKGSIKPKNLRIAEAA